MFLFLNCESVNIDSTAEGTSLCFMVRKSIDNGHPHGNWRQHGPWTEAAQITGIHKAFHGNTDILMTLGGNSNHHSHQHGP